MPVDLSEAEVLFARTCSVQGVADSGIFALGVASEVQQTRLRKAWRFDANKEEILEIDASGVECMDTD